MSRGHDGDAPHGPYCAAHDPLTRAGFLECQICRTRSYPGDAGWFGPRILATYVSACPHVASATYLIDPAQIQPSRLCAGIRADGEHCRAYPMRGQAFCHPHRHQRTQ